MATEQTKNFASMGAEELNALLNSLKSGQAELRAGQAKLEAELQAAIKAKDEAEAKLRAEADKTFLQRAKDNWLWILGSAAAGAMVGAASTYYSNSSDEPSTGDMQ